MPTAELMSRKGKVSEPELSNFVTYALLAVILSGYSHIHTICGLLSADRQFPAGQIPPAMQPIPLSRRAKIRHKAIKRVDSSRSNLVLLGKLRRENVCDQHSSGGYSPSACHFSVFLAMWDCRKRLVLVKDK